MDKAIQRGFHLRARGYLFDFLVSRYPSHIVSGLLAIIAGMTLWSMLSHKTVAGSAPSAATVAPRPDSVRIAQKVAMAHLFGQGLNAEVSAAQAAAVNITVEGIIYSEDKESALAIMKLDGHSDIYRIGDSLPDGEKLLAIAPTAVEIGSQGAPRILTMQQDFGDGGSGPLLAGIVAAPGRDDFFQDTNTAPRPVAYAPSLRPVLLSQNADPLSQLRSLRQQLIRQAPPNGPAHPAKHPPKP